MPERSITAALNTWEGPASRLDTNNTGQGIYKWDQVEPQRADPEVNMLRGIIALAAVAASAFLPCLVKANDFAGANSYYLYAVSVSVISLPLTAMFASLMDMQDSDRLAVLDAMKSANMKCKSRSLPSGRLSNTFSTVLRIFITQVAQGTKGSTAVAVNDLETVKGQSRALYASHQKQRKFLIFIAQSAHTMIQSWV